MLTFPTMTRTGYFDKREASLPRGQWDHCRKALRGLGENYPISFTIQARNLPPPFQAGGQKVFGQLFPGLPLDGPWGLSYLNRQLLALMF